MLLDSVVLPAITGHAATFEACIRRGRPTAGSEHAPAA